MGFINSGGGDPPRPPAGGLPADEPPPGDGAGEMAALSATVIESARAATSRYRRRPEAIGRYAWAISLGLHAIVLVGAYIAVRYYFPHTRATPVAAPPNESVEPSSIIMSPDVTDAVHGSWTKGLMLAADPAFTPSNDREIPPTIAREPQTIATLDNLAPRSAVDASGDSGSTPWPLSPLPSSNASRR